MSKKKRAILEPFFQRNRQCETIRVFGVCRDVVLGASSYLMNSDMKFTVQEEEENTPSRGSETTRLLK